jgi:hypothetical protein
MTAEEMRRERERRARERRASRSEADLAEADAITREALSALATPDLSNASRAGLPPSPPVPDAGEPPDEPRELPGFRPTTRQVNQQRDQALYNPEANRRSAQVIGDRWRARDLANPRPQGELARGARPDSPFRVYPPGQLPPRSAPYFPPQSEWSQSDLPDIGPPPPDVAPSAPRVIPPSPAPTGGNPAEMTISQEEVEAAERGEPAPTEMVITQEEVEAAERQAAPAPPQRASQQLASPTPPGPEFVDPSKPEGGPPDIRELARAQMAKRAQAPQPEQPARAEPDYTGVDVADGFRRVLHNLSNALRSRAGTQRQDFRSLGEEARQRDAQQTLLDQRAQQQSSQARMQNERLGMERERLDAQTGDLAQRRELEARRADISERMQSERARIAQEQADIRMTIARRQLMGIENEQAREAAQDDPSSPYSQQMQNNLRMSLRGYHPAAEERIHASSGEIAGMSGRSVETLLRQMRSGMFSDLRRPARRTGGRGPGGARGAETQSAMVTRAQEAGLTPQQIASYGSDRRGQQALLREVEDREQETRRDASRTQRDEQRAAREAQEEAAGVEIIPGVRATLDVGDVEARTMRAGLAEASGHSAAIGTIEDIASRYGPQAAIDPRVEGELVAATQSMMSMVAALRNSGVINPQEAPEIRAAIPNPTNLRQMTLGEVRTRSRAFRNLLEQRVRRNLVARGVDDAGVERAIVYLRTGQARRPQRAQGPQGEGAPQARTEGIPVRIAGVDRVLRDQQAVENARRVAQQRGDTFEVP